MRTAKWGALIVTAVVTTGLAAQQPRGKGGDREIIQRADISGTRLEAVGAVHKWAPHTATNWHTHPGEIVGYVTEGTVAIEQAGRQTLTVKAGESFAVPAGVPHNTINDGDGPAQMFVTYIVPKDTALSRGVPQ